MLSLLNLPVWASSGKPPGTVLQLSQTTLHFPASDYHPSAIDWAVGDLQGLMNTFRPETPNDPTLIFKGKSFDPKSSKLVIRVQKDLPGPFNPTVTVSGKISIAPSGLCQNQGKGYELKFISDQPELKSVSLKLCASETRGALALHIQSALVTGNQFEDWAIGTFRDIFNSMIKGMNQHIKNKVLAMRTRGVAIALPTVFDPLSPSCATCSPAGIAN